MNRIKKFLLIIAVILSSQFPHLRAQLTLNTCYEKARNNYPLVRHYRLIEQTENYTLSNASKGYLPQFSISARATYQSDVTALPVSMPGFKVLTKDQYQAIAEVNQVIWDGGSISAQIKIIKASTEVDKQKFEVDMYALREKVNQIFFGILLLNEQISLNEILQKELENNYNRVSALIQNGLANQPDLDAVRVEQLKTKQKSVELLSTAKVYREMLSAFIGEVVTETTFLVKPDYKLDIANYQSVNRPELKLFEAQRGYNESQKKAIYSDNQPKIGLFLQGGYGKPGLNMLKSDLSPFYLGGIRMSWNLWNLYTHRNNLGKIELNNKSIDVQKEVFLFNTNLKVAQQNNEIDKILEVIKTDDEIVLLRAGIKKSAEAKVENGTLNVTELIREINAENMAAQEKALHEIQLLISFFNLKNTTNN